MVSLISRRYSSVSFSEGPGRATCAEPAPLHASIGRKTKHCISWWAIAGKARGGGHSMRKSVFTFTSTCPNPIEWSQTTLDTKWTRYDSTS